MIPFNKPCLTGNEEQFVLQSLRSKHISGDGEFTHKCHQWFENTLHCPKALLTTSCTHALEMSAMLLDIQEGDEIIMPSYTFVSTANAFVLRGATIVFVDIRLDTMNIDETKIEQAITVRTKAIVPVHYAGVACEMDTIMAIANEYNLFVVEDAAQAMMSEYKSKALGTIGHLGAFSFHETKNYTSGGEGGLLIINDEKLINRAEIIREKGTNRSQFVRGVIDKYSWIDIGSSYLMSDLQAAYLWGQIGKVNVIARDRLKNWKRYSDFSKRLVEKEDLKVQIIPPHCKHNGHMFYMKLRNVHDSIAIQKYLAEAGVVAAPHYIPLHSSPAGKLFSRFHGADIITTVESEKLIRLPLYFGLSEENVSEVCEKVYAYF